MTPHQLILRPSQGLVFDEKDQNVTLSIFWLELEALVGISTPVNKQTLVFKSSYEIKKVTSSRTSIFSASSGTEDAIAMVDHKGQTMVKSSPMLLKVFALNFLFSPEYNRRDYTKKLSNQDALYKKFWKSVQPVLVNLSEI